MGFCESKTLIRWISLIVELASEKPTGALAIFDAVANRQAVEHGGRAAALK
jgi:hypothetical protein